MPGQSERCRAGACALAVVPRRRRKLFSEGGASSADGATDASRALDREVAALLDWESVVDFPHGSFRMLGSRKSKQLVVVRVRLRVCRLGWPGRQAPGRRAGAKRVREGGPSTLS